MVVFFEANFLISEIQYAVGMFEWDFQVDDIGGDISGFGFFLFCPLQCGLAPASSSFPWEIKTFDVV